MAESCVCLKDVLPCVVSRQSDLSVGRVIKERICLVPWDPDFPFLSPPASVPWTYILCIWVLF